ncbi:TIGR01212 family radical SAM protein [Deltaproteobacteria bacterium TL4]
MSITPYAFDHDKPYYPLSQRYRQLFQQKVFKVSVSVASTCPNRQGPQVEGCIFCDEWGAAAYHNTAQYSLERQIEINREAIRKRYRAEKFLIYFQAYTNTFGKMASLEEMYQCALAQDDVIGLIIGTRPDCLPERVLRLFEKIAQSHFLSVELGIQSLDDSQLVFLSRGHTSACSLDAIQKLKALTSVDICVHLMFGLPNETEEQLKKTAEILSELGIHGVKLHNLHVLRGTPLEKMYHEGLFKPVELEDYTRKVSVFLGSLSPQIAVHRLVAVASRWDDLVAPAWTKEKMRPTQHIENYLKANNLWQGKAVTREAADIPLDDL